MKYRCEPSEISGDSCTKCHSKNLKCDQGPSTSTSSHDSPPKVAKKRTGDNRLAALEASVDQLQALVSQLQTTQITHRNDKDDLHTVLSKNDARNLCDFCRSRMLSTWSFIVIPVNKTYEDVLAERPLLHQSMIAVAALMSSHTHAARLIDEIGKLLIIRHMQHFERSMDLLQALLLLTIYIRDLDKDTIRKCATFVNLAQQVASELDSDTPQDSWDPLEFERCYITVYIAQNGAKLWQTQFHSFHWTPSLERCAMSLRSGTDFDRNLAALARLMEAAKLLYTYSGPDDKFSAATEKFDEIFGSLDTCAQLPLRLGFSANDIFVLEMRLRDQTQICDSASLESGSLARSHLS